MICSRQHGIVEIWRILLSTRKVLNGLWKKWKGRDLDCVHESSLATHPSLPPATPHATHTPTSQTAYFVLQVRDLLSNAFMAGKIYLSIKLNADAASKWLWVTWRDKLQVWRREAPDSLNHLTVSLLSVKREKKSVWLVLVYSRDSLSHYRQNYAVI